jgi:hypothetical protein
MFSSAIGSAKAPLQSLGGKSLTRSGLSDCLGHLLSQYLPEIRGDKEKEPDSLLTVSISIAINGNHAIIRSEILSATDYLMRRIDESSSILKQPDHEVTRNRWEEYDHRLCAR